jgi:hypothetical protein
MDSKLRRRIAFILHRGLVEARLLAMGGKSTQIADLADALECLPGYLDRAKDDSVATIRSNLQTYASKYPDSRFEYVRYLDEYDPPEHF